MQSFIDDACANAATAIEKDEIPIFFKKYSPTALYSHSYEAVARHRNNPNHLLRVRAQQLDAVSSFCGRLSADNPGQLVLHLRTIHLLAHWFYCFFHHANLFYQRHYKDAPFIEDDVAAILQDDYITPHKEKITGWLREAWNVRQADPATAEVLRLVGQDDFLELYSGCVASYYSSIPWSASIAYMETTARCFEDEKKMFRSYFHNRNFSPIAAILRDTLVAPRQDALVSLWEGLVSSGDTTGARTFYKFFLWSTDHGTWVQAHRRFVEDRAKVLSVVALEEFFQHQLSLICGVFEDEKLRAIFVRALEDGVRNAFTPRIASQWVQKTHLQLSLGQPPSLLALLSFCPDRDGLYRHYHTHLKTRLLADVFDGALETMVLDAMETSFGASFVLNMRLMLRENTEEICEGIFGVRRLSKVAWGFQGGTDNVRLPPPVGDALRSLHAKWLEKTSPLIQLGLSLDEGVVVMTSGHAVTPAQAVALLALNEGPCRDSGDMPVFRSLEKAGLVVCEGGVWKIPSVIPTTRTTTLVPPPPPPRQEPNARSSATHTIVEADIVRTLKKEKTMAFGGLCRLLRARHENLPVRMVRVLVGGLVRRDFLSWDEPSDRLTYLP